MLSPSLFSDLARQPVSTTNNIYFSVMSRRIICTVHSWAQNIVPNNATSWAQYDSAIKTCLQYLFYCHNSAWFSGHQCAISKTTGCLSKLSPLQLAAPFLFPSFLDSKILVNNKPTTTYGENYCEKKKERKYNHVSLPSQYFFLFLQIAGMIIFA